MIMRVLIGLFACLTVISAASIQYKSPNADSEYLFMFKNGNKS